MILGMDWLSVNQAYLDCKKKRVLQGPCDSDMELIFQGSLLAQSSCVISYTKAVKMLQQGCQAFIASVEQVGQQKPTDFASILVVQNFPEVFPEKFQVFHHLGKLSLRLLWRQGLNLFPKHPIGWHQRS